MYRKYFWTHLSDLKCDVTVPFRAVGGLSLGSIEQHRRKRASRLARVTFHGCRCQRDKRKRSRAIIRLSVLRGQKFKRLVTFENQESVMCHWGRASFFSRRSPCVCPLYWLTARGGSLCWWRQNTSFVCLVVHGVFCLPYHWTALTHWDFH